MSPWVDFGLYSLQAVLLWIALPAWGARFLKPVTQTDATRARRGGRWIGTLRAWGVISVLALLAYRLDAVPPPLSATALRKSGWEVLLMTSNLMLALGLFVTAYGVLRFVRWLKENHTETQQEPSETFARVRDDFLPHWLQNLAYALMMIALLARPVAGWIRPDRVQAVWGNFFTGLLLALLLFFAAAGSVMRAPNQLDRALGEQYRQLEVNACYLLMMGLALLEISGLALELSAQMSRRPVALLVAAFVSIMLGGLMLLSMHRPRARGPVELGLPQ